MTAPLARIELGEDGLSYIRRKLEGWPTLSSHLLNVIDGGGSVTAVLPSDITPEAARRFADGGVLPTPVERYYGRGSIIVPVSNTDDFLATDIEAFLSGRPDRICVMEDANRDVHNPHLAEFPDILVRGDSIYHVVTGPSASHDGILKSIGDATAIYHFVGAMTLLPPGLPRPLAPRQEVSEAQLQYMAEHADSVFVGAYDGESFLMWRRK